MLNKLENYILDFASCEEEPLHIVIQSVLSKDLCKKPEEIVEPIIKLHKKHYLDIFDNDYKLLKIILKEELIKYVSINKPNNFEKYPTNEYYIYSTDDADDLIKDLDDSLLYS